jgi:peptidoglycan/xylan/chitin deacetylase (PgdA/CDA1 family)
VIFPAIIHLSLLATVTLVSAVPLDTQQTVIHLQGVGDIITKCTVPNTVALTFDDGPYYYTTVRRAYFLVRSL